MRRRPPRRVAEKRGSLPQAQLQIRSQCTPQAFSVSGIRLSFGFSLLSSNGLQRTQDEIRDNVTRMRREWEAQRNALATVRRFNATLSAKGYVWFWPKIAAALTSKHHWLVINCDSCGTVVDLDLRVKPRDPEASIRVALRDVQCPRCNGYGRPRIIALARHVR